MIKKDKSSINDSNILHFDKNITIDNEKDTIDANDNSDDKTNTPKNHIYHRGHQ